MVDEYLQREIRPWKMPVTVYEPIKYSLSSGGKRLRAVLVLLSATAVGGNAKTALPAAASIEMLHNFTLIHDDVMDHAAMRRGIPTIHTKWDENVAILAGDTLLAQAYRFLLRTPSRKLPEVVKEFTEAFIRVCEGQALDKEFECNGEVTLNDYFGMIEKKTAWMISSATTIGAILGDGSKKEVLALRKFGKYLGVAFQIQDDLLDVVGEEMKFGKKIGGDIIEGKKTFLLLTALARAQGKERKLLESIVPGNPTNGKLVPQVRDIFLALGVIEEAHREISRRTIKAQRAIAAIPQNLAKRELLALADSLAQRRV